jgi:Glycosyl transferases group 1
MRWCFFGPPATSGIGQVTRKWARLVHGDYIEFGQPPGTKEYEIGFAYILPLDGIINLMQGYARQCKKMVYYTVCETDPVNSEYQKIFTLATEFYTTSEFCVDVFSRQFPQGQFKVLKNYAFPPAPIERFGFMFPPAKYTFYHIGNIADPRKNINKLIECFYRTNIPGTMLVLKATCNQPVTIKAPGVVVINDFLTDGQMEHLHSLCDCYVSIAHSEGAGMGAVEAAMRHKPVIIQEYGGTKEYVRTPWVIPCKTVPVGQDDFLFKKDHTWGEPDVDTCVQFMQDVFQRDIRVWNHKHTYDEMARVPIQLIELLDTNK